MLSVVIATLNHERALVPTLASLVPGATAGTVREVIVADGGSTDATSEVADIAGCAFFAGPAALAQRLCEAVAKARSPWLMFIRPGVVLAPSWIDACAHFAQQAELQQATGKRAAVFRRGVNDETGGLKQTLEKLRAALGGSPHPDQGLMLHRRCYEQLTGHRDTAKPEQDLLARIGRRNIITLRCDTYITAADNHDRT
jgi:hypothetical protein